MEDKKINLIFGIIKAIAVFVFHLFLLIPMLMITIVMAMIGAGENSVVEAIGICISQPFKALGEAIRSIKGEVDIYKYDDN